MKGSVLPLLLGFILLCAHEKLQTVSVTPSPQVLTLGLVVAKYAGKHEKLLHDLLSGLSDQLLNFLPIIKHYRTVIQRIVCSKKIQPITHFALCRGTRLGTDGNRYLGTKG